MNTIKGGLTEEISRKELSNKHNMRKNKMLWYEHHGSHVRFSQDTSFIPTLCQALGQVMEVKIAEEE